MNRRTCLRTIAATTGTIAVAGCVGEDDDTTAETADDGADTDDDGTDTDDSSDETEDDNGTDTDDTDDSSDETEDEPVTVVDHDFNEATYGGVDVEITVENNTEEDQSATTVVEVYDDDSVIDDRTLLLDVSAGSTATEDGFMANLETSDLDDVTHYTIQIGVGIGGDLELVDEYSGDDLRSKFEE